MKCLVILFVFISFGPAWSKDSELLKCLGKEERRLHVSKKTGPLYDLNQRLISEMVQIPQAEFNPAFLKQICAAGSFSESWKLLEVSIKNGKELFTVPNSLKGMQGEVTLSMINDYLDSTREILISFINAIQMVSPTPACLKEEIPELDAFFYEIKYLQEDVDLKRIFQGKDQKIFDQLKGYSTAFDRCRVRLKKKAKSGSVPDAKKP